MSDQASVSDEDRAFAAEVRRLLSAYRTNAVRETVDFEALRVASSLRVLRDALNAMEPGAALNSVQLVEALSMLGAIETGAVHPVWRFLGAARPKNHPAPSHSKTMRRAIVVVVSDLFKESGERAFVEKTIRRLWDADIQVGKTAVTDWRARRKENRLDEMILMIRERLPRRAGEKGTDLITCAVGWAVECWTFMAD